MSLPMNSDTFDNAFDGLIHGTEDHRWAFGTGFTDPLEGIEVAPTARPMPQRDMALKAYHTAGKPPRTPFVLSRWMLRAAYVRSTNP